MTDAELRGRLLSIFYDRRHNSQGWVPTSDIDLGGQVSHQVIGTICRELADSGLIRWKPLMGAGEGLIIGMAQINGYGVDVVEGFASAKIAVVFPKAPTDTRERGALGPEHPLSGISPARIANWERHGVDAIEADLANNQGVTYVGGPPGTREQALRWVRYKRSQQQDKRSEVLSLKPGVYGVSLDLKAAFKRAHDWWKRQNTS
jgi:hypothetical protein